MAACGPAPSRTPRAAVRATVTRSHSPSRDGEQLAVRLRWMSWTPHPLVATLGQTP
jgi:hypothetical protein